MLNIAVICEIGNILLGNEMNFLLIARPWSGSSTGYENYFFLSTYTTYAWCVYENYFSLSAYTNYLWCVYYIFLRCYPGPWKVLRRVRNKYICLHQQDIMPSLKEVALEILPRT